MISCKSAMSLFREISLLSSVGDYEVGSIESCIGMSPLVATMIEAVSQLSLTLPPSTSHDPVSLPGYIV